MDGSFLIFFVMIWIPIWLLIIEDDDEEDD
jgi:hypothetical protein